MEETPEGLAAAAATRDAIKHAKKRAFEAGKSDAKEPPPKRGAARLPAPSKHEVAIPDGYKVPEMDAAAHGTIHQPMWDGEMAKTYPFKLDSFQSTAIACIERNESVLVAAHTSAGKTVVAEYAIAKALKNNQRVVYTSPIKALSNQKYRELTEEFEDVGLMTGDVCYQPNAACVVMTTEIFRSMTYQGSELLREVSWVVFDEVHYMQDRERGVVWEEVIIQMPKEVRMVFLSATLPNSLQFAEWVASVHHSPCHVVSTDYRPTPLVHYAFPQGGVGLHLLVNDKGQFISKNFKALQAEFKKKGDEEAAAAEEEASAANGKGGKDNKKGGKGGGGKDKKGGRPPKRAPPTHDDLRKLIALVRAQRWEPVIVFSFNRRDCEAYAKMLVTDQKPGANGGAPPIPAVDFNNELEKKEVAKVFNAAMQCLSPEDRDLACVKTMLPILQRGVGVHHSGLLPILKELVEVLFQEQLIKCLFATETFAMGLNMPAKTVIFTTVKKWDGEENRTISSGEYIQMSGRAGRRGKDDLGFVLMLVDGEMDEASCRDMIQGKAKPLLSQFKLSYYTLLNLIRRAEGTGMSIAEVISRSFSQYQHDRDVPELKQRAEELRKGAEASEDTFKAMQEYLKLREQAAAARAVVQKAMIQPDKCIHVLRPGRIVRVTEDDREWGYGVVVSVQRQDKAPVSSPDSYIVDTLLYCSPPTASKRAQPLPLTSTEGEMVVVPVALPLLSLLSTLRIAIPAELKSAEQKNHVLSTLQELVRRYPDGELPELDPGEDLGIKDSAVLAAATEERSLKKKIRELESAGAGDGASSAGDVATQLEVFRKKAAMLAEADKLERKAKESDVANFQEEARNRLAVLRKLGHVSADDVVTDKGKAACEVDTGDELMASEMMFNGTFGSLDKHQLAALVSCLVPVENSNSEIKLAQELSDGLRRLQDTARRIIEVSQECKVTIDADAYMESFKPSLMNVMYEWSKGASFGTICELTDMFEGSIIRAMRRQDELMGNLEHAAKGAGDNKLADKFHASRETLRRGLPFAASLYV